MCHRRLCRWFEKFGHVIYSPDSRLMSGVVKLQGLGFGPWNGGQNWWGRKEEMMESGSLHLGLQDEKRERTLRKRCLKLPRMMWAGDFKQAIRQDAWIHF